MIEFENVSVTLGEFRLNELSIRIEKGDYYFIIGPSGAGKTIILEAIAGLHHPDSGRVLIDGEDVSGIPPEKRKIALVYQDYSLFPPTCQSSIMSHSAEAAETAESGYRETGGCGSWPVWHCPSPGPCSLYDERGGNSSGWRSPVLW
ncbi:ATP-binding cassette domain-containing protein [Methanogenium cariaci]|uniref:ATP-binding cassette domain-containing protein n=1 Tax=Methanogenium cariaci TaxID=2197 RepID=UPI000784C691|nr:ATP-binding cassette domain-containing protein [Methanogenium cariaci]